MILQIDGIAASRPSALAQRREILGISDKKAEYLRRDDRAGEC
jgi:hypothetical protein